MCGPGVEPRNALFQGADVISEAEGTPSIRNTRQGLPFLPCALKTEYRQHSSHATRINVVYAFQGLHIATFTDVGHPRRAARIGRRPIADPDSSRASRGTRQCAANAIDSPIVTAWNILSRFTNNTRTTVGRVPRAVILFVAPTCYPPKVVRNRPTFRPALENSSTPNAKVVAITACTTFRKFTGTPLLRRHIRAHRTWSGFRSIRRFDGFASFPA